MGVGNVSRERQVLHWCPAGDQTNLPDVVVGIAVDDTGPKIGPDRATHTANTAHQSLGGVVVTDASPSTVKAAAPGRSPVVVEATAHTPGLNRLLRESCDKHGIRCNAKSNALVGEGIACAAKDGVGACATGQVLDIVAGSTIGIDALDHDGVTGAGRDVLDLQGTLNREAPLVVGMAKGLSTIRGPCAIAIIRDMVVMRGDRQLDQTPSLIGLDRGLNVRSNRSTIVTGAEGTETTN